MNRKQAKAQGGEIYKEWLKGYVWLKYHHANLTRAEYNNVIKSFVIGANSPNNSPTTKAYLWGMHACAQNFLKKRKYHTCTCKCTCR